MTQPLVSVITAAYNAEKYIGACIDSVLNQTYQNWDMWIVDDASKDGTQKIVEAYTQKYSNIHYIRLDKNSGDAAKPRNVALQNAQGRFVAFLDSDDMFLPTKLEKTVAFALEKEAAITYTAYRRMTPDSSSMGREIRVPEHIDRHKFMATTCINMSSSMIDRQKVHDVSFDEHGIKGREDLAMWVKLLKDHDGYGFNDPQTLYRRGHESVSSRTTKMGLATWEVYKRYAQDLTFVQRSLAYGQYALNAFLKHLVF